LAAIEDEQDHEVPRRRPHRPGRHRHDDLASTDPWRPCGIEIRGRAETVTEPHPLIRIHPDRVIAWGLDEWNAAAGSPIPALRPL
jgi:hypothetical protein